MKTITLILITTFVAMGCNKSENVEQNSTNSKLIGQWQLIERFDGGSPIPIQVIENGVTISFNTDMDYSNSNYTCGTGSYNLAEDLIKITIPCEPAELNYTYDFENSDLLLTGYPFSCPEGCYDRYKKINEAN
ncbi:hypothetical protein OAC97_00745 [Flavobacteriaceae bacterium]|nr:hypothetical protein [Flavobacteriaceae bacterium]